MRVPWTNPSPVRSTVWDPFPPPTTRGTPPLGGVHIELVRRQHFVKESRRAPWCAAGRGCCTRRRAPRAPSTLGAPAAVASAAWPPPAATCSPCSGAG
eukprot:1117139-Prorocentrum_minimum.AAC.1